MFWQEDDKPQGFAVSDEIVDLVFDIQCRELPVDHAHDLAQALGALLPQLGQERRLGVHTVHLAGSQNGWERPDPRLGQRLILSRRTKLTLRVPGEKSQQVQDALQRRRPGHRRLLPENRQIQAEEAVQPGHHLLPLCRP